jgi:hypothetical protein
MPSPDMCELTGTVLGPNGEGLATPGTTITCTVLSCPGYALEGGDINFKVIDDGTLKRLDGTTPARLPQGSTVRIRGSVFRFTAGASVTIPNLPEYEFRLLVPPAMVTSDSVSQAAFNQLYDLLTSMTGIFVFLAVGNFALSGNSGLAGAIF